MECIVGASSPALGDTLDRGVGGVSTATSAFSIAVTSGCPVDVRRIIGASSPALGDTLDRGVGGVVTATSTFSTAVTSGEYKVGFFGIVVATGRADADCLGAHFDSCKVALPLRKRSNGARGSPILAGLSLHSPPDLSLLSLPLDEGRKKPEDFSSAAVDHRATGLGLAVGLLYEAPPGDLQARS